MVNTEHIDEIKVTNHLRPDLHQQLVLGIIVILKKLIETQPRS
jgi:hypothetical protein